MRRRDREALAVDLKKIYRQNSRERFIEAFKEVKGVWGKIYPLLFKGWEEDLESLTSYFKYPEGIRRSIYTTNVVERFIKEVKRRSKVVEVFPTNNSFSCHLGEGTFFSVFNKSSHISSINLSLSSIVRLLSSNGIFSS